jgi:hypothetical protein
LLPPRRASGVSNKPNTATHTAFANTKHSFIMSGIAGKILSPKFYQQSLTAVAKRAHAYYHPLIRDNR